VSSERAPSGEASARDAARDRVRVWAARLREARRQLQAITAAHERAIEDWQTTEDQLLADSAPAESGQT